MVTVDRELERICGTLEVALAETEAEQAKYEIRRAAQQIEILRDGLDEETLELEIV